MILTCFLTNLYEDSTVDGGKEAQLEEIDGAVK